MKKIFISLFISLSILFTVYVSFSKSTVKYEFSVVFEKDFNSIDNSFFEPNFVLGKPSRENEIVISLLPTPNKWGVYIPELVYIDENENYYFVNRTESMKVFDKNSNKVSEFKFPTGFEFEALFFESDGNLIYQVSNGIESKSFLINSTNFSTTDINIYNYGHKKLYNLNEPIKYDSILICFSNEKKDIIENPNGKFIVPQDISLYFDEGSVNSVSSKLPEEYLNLINNRNSLLNINIEDYSNKKFIYTKGYYFDSNGNLFLTGIHSDFVENIGDNTIRVDEPTFFLWKFSKE